MSVICFSRFFNPNSKSSAVFISGHVICEADRMLSAIDFQTAARQLVPSVSAKDLSCYRELERKINQSP